MQYVQQLCPLTGRPSPFSPLQVTTLQPSRWQQFTQQLKETGARESFIEILLATSTFSLVGGLLFSLYRALAHFTVIPFP